LRPVVVVDVAGFELEGEFAGVADLGQCCGGVGEVDLAIADAVVDVAGFGVGEVDGEIWGRTSSSAPLRLWLCWERPAPSSGSRGGGGGASTSIDVSRDRWACSCWGAVRA
jgi:hypothetical protein